MIACQRMSAHLAAIALLKSSAAAIFVSGLSLSLTHSLTHRVPSLAKVFTGMVCAEASLGNNVLT